MKVHEKIDLLMKICNTGNSQLGKALSFDASYISRIRAGKRGLPKNQPFLEPLAVYFSRNLTEEYQKKMLYEEIIPGKRWPDTCEQAQELLYGWLCRRDSVSDDPMGTILSGEEAPCLPDGMEEGAGTRFFYGNEGKRHAVEALLTELCRENSFHTLLLSSNEAFDWLYEDGAFVKRWTALMVRFLSQGGHIKIIHAVNRGANDMLEALQKWMPIYMSGAIEPYYYPKLRDRVYRRSLLIVPGKAAIAASSVETHTDGSLNVLLHDPRAVGALEQEFNDYFSLCKPLMQVFNYRNRELFCNLLRRFEDSDEEMILALPVPAFSTMPLKVAESMARRCGSKWLLTRREEGVRRVLRQLELGHPVTEIFHLPDIKEANAGKLLFPMSDLFDRPGLAYTPGELKAHLARMVCYLREYEDYHVILSDEISDNEIIYVKEDLGAIVVKARTPSVAFGISEQRLTSAFWGYLSRIADEDENRAQTIQTLERYIQKLQD